MAKREWYDGRDPDADWRRKAEERIDEYRKGTFTVVVVDGEDQPVEGVEVHVEQTDHAFGFGTMVDAALLLGDDDEYDPSTQEQFREAFTTYFNRGTINYGFYPWQWMDPENDQGETGAKAVEWLVERNYPVHGHTVLWNEIERTLPDIRELDDPDEIRARLREHISDQVGTFAGSIDEWDVINHAVWLNDLWEENLGGDRSDWLDWLSTARDADPEATLFVNEEALRDDDTARNNDREYRKMLDYLTENDADLDGVGFMGHFTPDTLLAPSEVIDWLDAYQKYDVELQITEFDVAQGWHAEQVEGEPPAVDEAEWREVQADYVRDFLIAVVSHSAVTAFITWGFWAGRMWRPDGAFFSEHFELTPAGAAYVDLVYNEWWTTINGETDENGHFEGGGFAGTYEVTVRDQDSETRREITLDSEATTVRIRR